MGRLSVSSTISCTSRAVPEPTAVVFRQIGVDGVGTCFGHCRRSCWTVSAVGFLCCCSVLFVVFIS